MKEFHGYLGLVGYSSLKTGRKMKFLAATGILAMIAILYYFSV